MGRNRQYAYFGFHETPFYGGKGYWGRRNKYRQRKMRGLFNLITFLLTIGVFVTGAFYLLAKFLGQIVFDPNSQAWKRTVQKLQDRLRTLGAGALIPWDDETASLLSLNRIKVKKPGYWNNMHEGIFTTIYQEPVLAYAGLNVGKTSVYIARSGSKEYIFRHKERETEIWINNTPFAVYANGVLLAPGRSTQVLARLEYDGAELQWPVLIGDKAAAAVNNPDRAESLGPNPRAVTLLRKLTPAEEDAVVALALIYVLKA